MSFENAPLGRSQIVPLSKMVHNPNRKYIRANSIIVLATKKYEINGKGITYVDLITNKLATRKKQAQRKLKYLLSQKELFTIENCKPQRYFPFRIKSKIMDNLKKKENVPVRGTGLGYSEGGPNSLDERKVESVSQILSSLQGAPLYLHKIRLHTNIDKKYYSELEQEPREYNKAKVYEEHIGKAFVRYVYSPNGKVEIQISCSEAPYKIESETDEAGPVFVLRASSGQNGIAPSRSKRTSRSTLDGLVSCSS